MCTWEFISMGLKIIFKKLYTIVRLIRGSLSLKYRENVNISTFLDIIAQVLVFSKKS